jgi:hypothetical protein
MVFPESHKPIGFHGLLREKLYFSVMNLGIVLLESFFDGKMSLQRSMVKALSSRRVPVEEAASQGFLMNRGICFGTSPFYRLCKKTRCRWGGVGWGGRVRGGYGASSEFGVIDNCTRGLQRYSAYILTIPCDLLLVRLFIIITVTTGRVGVVAEFVSSCFECPRFEFPT